MTSIAAATPTALRPADVEVPAWATQADERQTLPPITCTPWCVDGDGHPNEVFHGDQWCHTEEQATMLTRDYRYRDNTSEIDTVAVAVQRNPGRLPEVSLRHTAPDDVAYLSPAEARQVAAALIAAADLLDGAR